MPGASRTRRTIRHSSAVQVPNSSKVASKRRFDNVPDDHVERVLPGSGADQTVTEIVSSSFTRPKKSKTLKPPPGEIPGIFASKPRRDLDLGLPTTHPYSRSHLKREKRKAKERLAGGRMAEMAAALDEVHQGSEQGVGERGQQKRMGVGETKSKEKSGHGENLEKKDKDNGVKIDEDEGVIGEGKGKFLTERARRAQIAINARRIPAVMKHPAFKASPWATIRLHASNSLAPHEKKEESSVRAGSLKR